MEARAGSFPSLSASKYVHIQKEASLHDSTDPIFDGKLSAAVVDENSPSFVRKNGRSSEDSTASPQFNAFKAIDDCFAQFVGKTLTNVTTGRMVETLRIKIIPWAFLRATPREVTWHHVVNHFASILYDQLHGQGTASRLREEMRGDEKKTQQVNALLPVFRKYLRITSSSAITL
ncbi:hypothetical protein JCM3766R1_000438 [Sporobolomyces carnicolor]